ncbi:MAG TPA: hypothetical protein VK455_01320, partial [Thermoplasmata archaeon]|nr:hypothetical protein [Thermoplasmata archaeon]
MDVEMLGIALSLILLTATLGALAARGLVRYLHDRSRPQLMWGVGLLLAAVATTVELVVYLGFVDSPLLQTYVFLSAAIVGVLSLGSTRAIRSIRFRNGYTAYTLATCGIVGVFTVATPLSSSMVSGGVITGNPPVDLLILSTLVTVPATVVLLGAVVLSLRRSWQWRTVMMGIGASVLAGGGALYIASFPVALYYSEFIGIVLIFLGLVTLPQVTSSTAVVGERVGKTA